jgi:hypothetical protein
MYRQTGGKDMTAELDTYKAFFASLHDQISGLLDGLPAEALNWRPLSAGSEAEETNSLAANVVHITGSQRWLVGEAVGGRPANRDREAEFRAKADEAEPLQRRLDEASAFIADVLDGLSPGALEETVVVREVERTRRWCVVHSLAHTAMHLGHMQLTRQLWLAESQADPNAIPNA